MPDILKDLAILEKWLQLTAEDKDSQMLVIVQNAKAEIERLRDENSQLAAALACQEVNPETQE